MWCRELNWSQPSTRQVSELLRCLSGPERSFKQVPGGRGLPGLNLSPQDQEIRCGLRWPLPDTEPTAADAAPQSLATVLSGGQAAAPKALGTGRWAHPSA